MKTNIWLFELNYLGERTIYLKISPKTNMDTGLLPINQGLKHKQGKEEEKKKNRSCKMFGNNFQPHVNCLQRGGRTIIFEVHNSTHVLR